MIGADVTRDVALRVLAELDRELLNEVRTAFRSGGMPTRPGAYAAWVDAHEERLSVIEALTALVRAMPAAAVLAKGEVEAAAPVRLVKSAAVAR